MGCFFGALGLLGLCIYMVSCSMDPKYQEQLRQIEIERCKPHLMVHQQDLDLYRLNANCRGNSYEIYYSVKGTQWQRTESHMCGKHTCSRQVPMQITNQ